MQRYLTAALPQRFYVAFRLFYDYGAMELFRFRESEITNKKREL
ncbi:MAG: hypothetical protein ABF274_03310 [Nonlabens sp.]